MAHRSYCNVTGSLTGIKVYLPLNLIDWFRICVKNCLIICGRFAKSLYSTLSSQIEITVQRPSSIQVCIHPPPPLWAGCNTRSVFKWSKAGLNSVFFFLARLSYQGQRAQSSQLFSPNNMSEVVFGYVILASGNDLYLTNRLPKIDCRSQSKKF